MLLKIKQLTTISFWKWALLISVIVLLFGYIEKGWNNNYIHSDGLGYYSYLPAVFIYGDLSFNFIEKYEKEHYLPGQHYDFRQEVKQGSVNRYYAGTALLQLPFFLVTHMVCQITDKDPCGYSRPYQYSVLVAAYFYLFLGLWALMNILSFYLKRWLALLIPLLVLLSTPLLFYTIFNPDFSHIYSFAIVNIFIYNAIVYFQKPSIGKLLLLFVWVGIIVIIRPINIMIVLLLPFFASNWTIFAQGFYYGFKNYKFLILGVIISTAIVFVQLSMYYFQTGSFWVYSYGPYGFNFLKPHFIDILFSYRKGLFVYTPFSCFPWEGFTFFLKKMFLQAYTYWPFWYY